jgi:uncharacterized protein
MKYKFIKQIPKCILFCFFAINLYAQNTQVVKSDSQINKSLELSRKEFWDSLPKPTNWTNDYENLYSEAEQIILDSIITEFEKETSFEIGIVTIDTSKVAKENFNNLSLHIAKTWGIGKKNKDNGILIFISRGHKKIRIENGTGTEKIINEKETSEMIENYFIAEFRKDKFYDGTLNGLKAIIKLLKSKL